MPRQVQLLLVLAVLLAPLAAPPSSVARQSGNGDEQAATDAAARFSQLETQGRFNALYDRMHPDAQAIIPRDAVIGWYEAEFAPLEPLPITVTGVSFVDWTWGVTGATYPDTAEVSIEQNYADGSVAEDVVRLVQDASGEWRWFFGRDRAFVDEQIAEYAFQGEVVEGVFVAIASVDASDQQRLAGACYLINGGSIEGCDENGDGQVDFQGVVPGTYTVTETKAPAGYLLNEDFTVTFPSGQPSTVSVAHQAVGAGSSLSSDSAGQSGSGPAGAASGVAVGADATCEEYAQDHLVIAGTPGLTPDGVMVYSGCWQDAGGQWFLPIGTDDARFMGGPILDEQEQSQTAELRARIEDRLTGLDIAMESAVSPFCCKPGHQTMKETMDGLQDPVKHPVFGNLRSDWAKGTTIDFVEESYRGVFMPHVQNPENLELRRYANWWGQRRIDAYPTTAMEQLGTWDQDLLRSSLDPVGLDRAPWPWDLADPVTLDLYLEWTLDNGYA